MREFNVQELANTAGSSAIMIMRCAACECWGRTVTPRQALCGGNQNFQRNEAAIVNIQSKLELVRAAQSRIERHSAETTGNLQQHEAAISTVYLILTQGDSSWHEVTCQSFLTNMITVRHLAFHLDLDEAKMDASSHRVSLLYENNGQPWLVLERLYLQCRLRSMPSWRLP